MIALGLTGGVGMGKSVVAGFLQRRGLPVVDTDAIAREIVEPGQPALQEIRRAFGDAIVDSEGRLNRGDLAKRVFADPEARARLESILHPRIRLIWRQCLADWRSQGQPIGVVVIPLLFETGAAAAFDKTVCVACTAASQMQRLRERGWSDEESARRIGAQWPIEKKMESSDYVIWAEGELAVVEQQAGMLLDRLSGPVDSGSPQPPVAG